VGLGLDDNITKAYQWLGANYDAGDEIYLFGFSRGAYTARSLASFIGNCGLLTSLGDLSKSESSKRVKQAYSQGYQLGKPRTEWLADRGWAVADPRIQFLGVWDTVGSLGIPDELGILHLLNNPDRYKFHDTNLGSHVVRARHAVAIDEVRSSFMPTFWTDTDDNVVNDATDNDRVRQLFFAGVHSDVGGSYAEAGLSDMALGWMMDAAQNSGLVFKPEARADLKPDPKGPLHDSLSGVFELFNSRPRNIPPWHSSPNAFHPSALERHATPPDAAAPYHPKTILLPVGGKSEPLSVQANKHWNETGIYLEEGGSYKFTATGEWNDGGSKSGPGGKEFRGPLGWWVSISGILENLYRRVTRNPDADMYGTRRIDTIPWMALVGVVTNDGGREGTNPLKDGSPFPHEMFLIGEASAQPIKIQYPGFFYAFANDAWDFYGNNDGAVSVVVERVS
jgi:hypothetical protein